MIGVLCAVLVMALFAIRIVNAAATVTLSPSGQTETTISLAWTKSTDSLFKNYQLYFSSTGVNGPYSSIWSTTNEAQTSTFVGGLSPHTDYWFYILDTDMLGNARSNTLQVTTTSNPQLTLTAQTTTTASLSWTDHNTYSSLVPFNSYIIQMSTSGANGPWSTLTTVTDPTQNTYVVTGLSSGLYYLKMYDNAGTSGNKQTANSNVVTLPIIAVTISSTATTIYLGQQVQFSASPSGGTGSYNYQWYSDGNPVVGVTSSSFAFNPTHIDPYNIYVVAQDSSDANA